MRGAGFWVAAWALGLAGCGTKPEAPKRPEAPFRGVKVRVGAVGEPAILKVINPQRGEWEQTRGGTVEVVEEGVATKEAAGLDVVIFRADRLGELVDAGALATLPETVVAPSPAGRPSGGTEDSLKFTEVVPALREQVGRYGEDRMGVPLGASALVLVYRRDALTSDANREAADKAGLGALEPPDSWERLDALARFFQGRDWDGDGKLESGIALALGLDQEEGVADATFLARAASVGQHPDQYSFVFDADTMAPRVAMPPFVEALEGLKALAKCGPEGVIDFDAEKARAAFRSGEVALLIDRAERASRWAGKEVPITVGVAPLPDSKRVFDPDRKQWQDLPTRNRVSYLPVGGGWLAALGTGASSASKAAAVDFLRYLVAPDTATRVRGDVAFAMLPARGDLIGLGLPDPRSAPGVDARLWAAAVGMTLKGPRVVPGLRIPEADGYLADLARGRVAAMKGARAEAALNDVARAWDDRTNRLGRDRQAWHYRRSLNALPTPPNPPSR
ncbi:MAG TPA: extracellular solute-binding protein [Isosphaeraceae bacterium]|jgi:multiple sugar transport system substrate-binding protein|nr:extracellular solute-binding protein [Isosphaeraceae bacterium]